MYPQRLLFLLMRTVGLKVIKNKLSEYVRLAAAGETVVGTDRGRVVAKIGSMLVGSEDHSAAKRDCC
jgi:hypothetical protein